MSFILLNQLYRLHGNGLTIPVLVHIKKRTLDHYMQNLTKNNIKES